MTKLLDDNELLLAILEYKQNKLCEEIINAARNWCYEKLGLFFLCFVLIELICYGLNLPLLFGLYNSVFVFGTIPLFLYVYAKSLKYEVSFSKEDVEKVYQQYPEIFEDEDLRKAFVEQNKIRCYILISAVQKKLKNS